MSLFYYLKPIYFILSFCLLCINTTASNNENHKKNDCVRISITPKITYQEMDGFGASDAWSCKFIGNNWPEKKRERIADLLFSSDTTENGDPKGIGLSVWRFNIGAGSFEQGDKSFISDPWRREECFLSPDGSYNWKKQAGQQWFLNAAHKRGVKNLIMFVNSPPVYLTKNGKAFSDSGYQMNIKSDKLDDFASFLTSVVEHFSSNGIPVNYISPENEPQWDWKPGSDNYASQEGTPATNSEMAQISRQLSKQLADKGLSTKIILSEAGKINYLYESFDKERGKQIDDYFTPSSINYVGNLKNMAPLICSHSYWSVFPVSDLIASRNKVKTTIDSVNNALKYWETEYSILEPSNIDMNGGWHRDLSMNPALYVGRIIHYAITKANASSWQWWTAISKYDFKDGLIYVDDSINIEKNRDMYCLNDGEIRESKLLWALGNYSFFIRPGMKRVSVNSPDSLSNREYGILPSAFIDSKKNKLVVVIINYSSQVKNVSLDVNKLKRRDTFTAYVTSEDFNLSKQGNVNIDKIELLPNSITTLVGHYNK